MKEVLSYQPKLEIKWPQFGKIEVGYDVDFIYIMRKDGNFTMSPIAQRMVGEHYMDEEQTKQVLLEGYDTFFGKLTTILQWGYSSKGNFELHLYDSNQLDKGVRAKAGNTSIVSLDPLMNQGVLEHKVSRGYYLGGKNDFGQVARPGAKPIFQQAQEIASSLNGMAVCVVEDDVFSGGSVIASLSELISNGVIVQKLIPGIQIGKPSKLSEMGITIDPVVTYETIDGADIFDKVDLGDPRDYLLGASGLVTKLPSGNYGRVPYILPFVSTAARAGIPQEKEKEFAEKVLQVNLEFFRNVKECIGKSILLKNMDPNFVVLMNEMFGFDSNAPMEQVVVWSMDNMDSLWEITKIQGVFQEKLAELNLPQNIVCLDVDGTIVDDDAQNDYIPEEKLKKFQKLIQELSVKGIIVGLCSDSPLPQLASFGKNLGIKGPLIAENGNIIAFNEFIVKVNKLNDSDQIKQKILVVANELELHQVADISSQVFGGENINFTDDLWGFGANRETSISIFGPANFINKLNEKLGILKSSASVGCYPEYNYLAIHPGQDYKVNKGITLSLLKQYGHSILMVGNTMQDWVNPDTGVKCAFVQGARITKNVAGNAAYISEKPLIDGVIDILERVGINED